MNEAIFARVEQNLRLKMKPLQPAPEFVDNLRNRLVSRSGMEIEKTPDHKRTWLMIVIGFSLATALVLFLKKNRLK